MNLDIHRKKLDYRFNLARLTVSEDMSVVQWQTNEDECGWARGEKVLLTDFSRHQKSGKFVINVNL